MIRGSCLCGRVAFAIDRAEGPFEFCHCPRCRKASGSAFVAGLGVRAEAFHWLTGRADVRTFEAPLREQAPAYRRCFCPTCGSPVPDPEAPGDRIELPAGLLEDDPRVRPDRHIFVEHRAPWYEIGDDLPRLDAATLRRHRASGEGAPGSEES